MECKELPLNSIFFPENFPSFLFETASHTFQYEIITNIGIPFPLLVRPLEDERFQLAGGFAWFSAVKLFTLTTVPCQIVPETTHPFTFASHQIVHARFQDTLSPILQGYFLNQAQQHLSEDKILSLMTLMGHKPHLYLCKELIDLLKLDISAIVALHNGSLSFQSGRILKRLPRQDQKVLVDLIARYQLGGSKQQKLIELTTELTMRTSQPVQDMIQGWSSEKKNTGGNPPQESNRLLDFLQRENHPLKDAAERKFKALVKELAPPDGMSINHSPSFEDETIEVRLQFANATALIKKWQQIKSVAEPHT